MGEVLFFSLNAVMPLVLLILFGYWLRQRGFFTDEFLKLGNRFTFRFALPFSLFTSIYGISEFHEAQPAYQIALAVSVLLLFAVGWAAAIIITRRRDRRAVLIQSMFRGNFASVGLALSAALGGEEASCIAALSGVVVVGLYNILAVSCLSYYSPQNGKKLTPLRLVLNILKNPLIMGILAGLFCLFVRTFIMPVGADGLPLFTLQKNLPFLYSTVSRVGSLGSTLALIFMGGQFRFDAMGDFKKELAAGTLFRTAIGPLLGFACILGVSRLMGLTLTSGSYAVAAGLLCSPMAVATPVMCGEMGSDSQLAGQVVVWSSIGAVFSMFAASFVLKVLGLL